MIECFEVAAVAVILAVTYHVGWMRGFNSGRLAKTVAFKKTNAS